MKIILYASPLSAFWHKVHNIRFEKQLRALSWLTAIELRPPVSVSSTKISKFYDPTDSEHQFHEMWIKNLQSIGVELWSSWLGNYSQNHFNIFNLQYDGEA